MDQKTLKQIEHSALKNDLKAFGERIEHTFATKVDVLAMETRLTKVERSELADVEMRVSKLEKKVRPLDCYD